MEKPEGDKIPVTGDVVTLPIKPFEILTVEVGYSPQ
jgi:alpha-mannosidase